MSVLVKKEHFHGMVYKVAISLRLYYAFQINNSSSQLIWGLQYIRRVSQMLWCIFYTQLLYCV